MKNFAGMFLVVSLFLVASANADIIVRCNDRFTLASTDSTTGDNTYIYGLKDVRNTATILITNNGETAFVPTITFTTNRISKLYDVEYMRDYWVTIDSKPSLLTPNEIGMINISVFFAESLKADTSYYGELNVSCDQYSKAHRILLYEAFEHNVIQPSSVVKIGNFYVTKNVIAIFGLLAFALWAYTSSKGGWYHVLLLIALVCVVLYFVPSG